MREKIDCFLPCNDLEAARDVVAQIKGSKTIQHICLLVNEPLPDDDDALKDCQQIMVNNLTSSTTIAAIAESAKADYALLQIRPRAIQMPKGTLDRMLRIATDSDAAMIYSDHYDLIEGKLQPHPVIDYQIGSVRDDFDLGSLILVKTSLLHTFALQAGEHDYHFAAIYALRLFLSREGRIFHINEKLYTEHETDTRASGEKQFDYVNPRNREVQIEMEQVATAHLEAIGAKIDPSFYRRPDFNEQEFDVEASVVIPVFNRQKTIRDAVNSALGQKTKFKFNAITTLPTAPPSCCARSTTSDSSISSQSAWTWALVDAGTRPSTTTVADALPFSSTPTTSIRRPRRCSRLSMPSTSRMQPW